VHQRTVAARRRRSGDDHPDTVDLERLSPCPEDELRHPEYVLELPQSGVV
jgi:hypothetical protein